LDKRVAPLPMAINSVAYQGRPACIQDGWCDAGCPTGALANPIVLYGKRMRDAGVMLRTDACVRTILVDASGTRATGVVYGDALGREHTVRAKLVVLAAFSVQTPRLLLNSVHPKHPKGLGNNAGLVGRYFTAHGAVNIFGLFDEPTFSFMGRTGGQLVSQEDYLTSSADGHLGSRTWRIGQSLKLGDIGGIANTRPELMGPQLAQFMQHAPAHIATMNALVDNPASRTNSVSLTSDKDSQGLPLARISHELSADSLRCLADAAEEGKRIFKAAGATEIWAAPHRTEHLMGGTIMGTRADNSVTNEFGAVHGVENLYISGTGLFPSVGAVNPTFTAMALAARTAEHINREWAAVSA
jgi:choline dehydrogenase-like flavoprotein